MSENQTPDSAHSASNKPVPRRIRVTLPTADEDKSDTDVYFYQDGEPVARLIVRDGNLKHLDLPRDSSSDITIRSSNAPSINQAVSAVKKRQFPWIKVGAALLSTGLLVQSCAELTVGNPTDAVAYPVLKATLPKIGVGNIFAEHDEPDDSCNANGAIDTIPNYEQSRQTILETEFLENDMVKLDSILQKLIETDSLKQARSLAKEYLKELGINVEFYSAGADYNVKYGDNYKASLYQYPSDFWKVNDKTKITAIGNFVLAITSRPKSFFKDFKDTIILVPDNKTIQGVSGHLHPPSIASTEGFVIEYSLSNFEDNNDTALIDHELGHRLFSIICSIPDLYNDPAFKKINANGNVKIPDAFANTYGRDAGPVEDVATIWDDLWANGLSERGTARGSNELRQKQEVLIARFAKYTGISKSTIVNTIQFMRLYTTPNPEIFGINTHPIKMAELNLPEFFDPNMDIGELKEVISDGPLGQMRFYCKLGEESQEFEECRTGIMAAQFLPESTENLTKSWAEGLVALIAAADPELKACDDLGVSVYASEYDPNLPAKTKATAYYDLRKCDYPIPFDR